MSRSELVHRGVHHVVYRVVDDEGVWAVKWPARAADAHYEARIDLGGISTSWDVIATLGQQRTVAKTRFNWENYPASPEALLRDEAHRIARTEGAWNHHVRQLADPGVKGGELRELMKSVAYPKGWFFVERAVVILFGLSAQLAPKMNTVQVGFPYIMRMMAARQAAPAAPAAAAAAAAPVRALPASA